MTYRDDREALHHRVAQLEDELRDARREGEEHGRDEAQAKAKALEENLANTRAELAKMTDELERLRGNKPARTGSGVIIAVMVATAIALFVAGIVLAIVRTRSTTSTVSLPDVPTQAAPTSPTPPQPESPAPIRLEPILGSPRSTIARWNAKVTRAEGFPLGAGSECTVDATITTTDTNAIVRDIAIQCGTQSLYRSTDRQMSNDAREVLGASDDKGTFTLMYRDLGTRSGERAQLDLDTRHRQAVVFREIIPRFRVELSLPVTSAPTTPLADAAHRMRRTGKVSSATGSKPMKTGTACVLRAIAIGNDRECAAEVSCGGAIVWPSSAPVSCTYEVSRPVTVAAAADEGGTSLALVGTALTVKTKAVDMEITLDEP